MQKEILTKKNIQGHWMHIKHITRNIMGGMKEEVLTYGFFLQLFLKPAAEYVLKQTGDWEHFLQAIFEQSLMERYRLQTAEKPAFEERLFLRIESWLCTLRVRERDKSGKLKWIVDLEGHQHVDI